MQRLHAKAVVLALVAGAVACSPPAATTGQKQVSLKIKSGFPTPSAVFNEGGDPITVAVDNGCALADVSIKVDGVPVGAASIVSDTAGTYKFPAPPKATDQKVAVPLVVTCAKPSDSTVAYAAGGNTDTGSLTYDPSLEPQPAVKTYAPFGDKISVLAKMVVTFTRDMAPGSITAQTVYMHSVPGKTTYDPSTRTATFTPDQQLPYGSPVHCVVEGGPNGVHSAKTGKTLQTHLASGDGTVNPNEDTWDFTTRCEGCGNPWIGDISAAAGISTGGNYKLFSVTGAPTPVGTSFAGTEANHTYKLQSGFLYATEPSTGGN